MIKKIAVVGLGYVGLPLALLTDKKGYDTVGIIRNKNKTDQINKRIAPFKDRYVEKLLHKTNLRASINFQEIKKTSIIIICVPTPVNDDYSPNLEPVISAVKNIGKYLQKGQLVILESTVNPGVCEEVILPILEKKSGLKGGRDFHLSHCPERINPGDNKWNVENINRVVGSLDKTGLQKTSEFYRSILDADVKEMDSIKEAEAVKIVENSFRDINIAFVNEMALSFSKIGIDIKNVIEGAATKPFGFMAHYPGCGVGGHCIPVDPYYLIEYAKKNGFYHDFLSLARRINNRMPEYTVELLIKGLNEKKIATNGTKIAVLGLAYKRDIDDDRESPAYKIVKLLKEYKAKVTVYDPYLLHKSDVKALDEALRDAKAVILVTNHTQFKQITPELLLKHGVKVLIDGKNFYDKNLFLKKGIVYKGIGR